MRSEMLSCTQAGNGDQKSCGVSFRRRDPALPPFYNNAVRFCAVFR